MRTGSSGGRSREKALRDRPRLIAQIMVYGDLQDTQAMLRAFSRNDLLQMLDSPPPGIFSERAKSFWHVYLHKEPRQLRGRFTDSADTLNRVSEEEKPPNGIDR